MQIFIPLIKNLLFAGNPMFYLNFYPQRLALGFQLLSVGLNRAEKAIVGDLESFPSSSPQTRSLQIQVVPAPGFQLIGDQALNEMACPSGN